MNPIINTLIGGNNSMESLNFYWKAFFSDGSILEQFENGIENKFQKVKDNFDKLIRFSLVNKDYSQCFTVDLQNGFIIYNNRLPTDNREKKDNVRLIYFRRIRKILNEQLQEVKCIIHYHLGFQYNDKLGNNQKIILQIDEQGNWILGD
jgi:hypothetical protein